MRLAVYICANAHYIPLAMLFMESFAERAQISQPFDFYCFSDSEEMVETFCLEPAYNWVKFRRGYVTDLPNFTAWPDAFYYGMGMKIYALHELRPHYDRILYLDVDMMINRPLDDLVNADLQGKALGAVPDFQFSRHGMIEIREKHLAEILTYRDKLMGQGEAYINSGMFLVDCAQPVALPDYDEFAVEWQPSLIDQDYLNFAYRDNMAILPDTFNFMVDQAFMNRLTYQARIGGSIAMSEAHIQHFHGQAKPWKQAGSYGYEQLLDGMNTARFFEVYDRLRPLFEDVPDYGWLTENIAINRPRLEQSDALAARFAERLRAKASPGRPVR
jgi:lipopolysaccharide biosynthesis glycosyltransferase